MQILFIICWNTFFVFFIYFLFYFFVFKQKLNEAKILKILKEKLKFFKIWTTLDSTDVDTIVLWTRRTSKKKLFYIQSFWVFGFLPKKKKKPFFFNPHFEFGAIRGLHWPTYNLHAFFWFDIFYLPFASNFVCSDCHSGLTNFQFI